MSTPSSRWVLRAQGFPRDGQWATGSSFTRCYEGELKCALLATVTPPTLPAAPSNAPAAHLRCCLQGVVREALSCLVAMLQHSGTRAWLLPVHPPPGYTLSEESKAPGTLILLVTSMLNDM
jgi:hypothetical protein